jgi:hypothetical protein
MRPTLWKARMDKSDLDDVSPLEYPYNIQSIFPENCLSSIGLRLPGLAATTHSSRAKGIYSKLVRPYLSISLRIYAQPGSDRVDLLNPKYARTLLLAHEVK